jgi:hypothetical protein
MEPEGGYYIEPTENTNPGDEDNQAFCDQSTHIWYNNTPDVHSQN